jgi:hypothetical protein
MELSWPTSRHDRFIAVISVVYVVLISVYMLAHRLWFSPDQFFIAALIGVLFVGKAKIFLLDWGPFVSLFLGYEYLRGLVPLISRNVHIFPMINLDIRLLGFVPSVKLQQLFYNPANLHWYDYVAVFLYISHFVMPMIAGFIFWLTDRLYFKKFTFSLLVLSYSAFFTFILFPAMPPWMASNNGYIPKLEEVTGVVMANFLPTTISMPSVYSFMRANPVAAIPSLHAAFPFLIFLFIFKRSRRVGLMFVPYVLGVWFAVMYLGEHYLTDVLIGAIYALGAFLLVVERRFLFGLAVSVFYQLKHITEPGRQADLAVKHE